MDKPELQVIKDTFRARNVKDRPVNRDAAIFKKESLKRWEIELIKAYSAMLCPVIITKSLPSYLKSLTLRERTIYSV